MKILIILLCLITLTGCKEEKQKEVEEHKEPVISYYNCVGQKGNEKRTYSFQFIDDKLENIMYDTYKDNKLSTRKLITKSQYESKEVTELEDIKLSDMYSLKKNQFIVKYNIGDYCTTSNEENWDIVVLDSLYEYTDIYLDYIDETAKSYGDVMYSWYILTNDGKVMNVVYMVDYDGFTYAYDDYQAPTLDQAKKNAKEDKMENVFNKEEYIKWLESLNG